MFLFICCRDWFFLKIFHKEIACDSLGWKDSLRGALELVRGLSSTHPFMKPWVNLTAFCTQKSQIYTWDGRQSDRWTKLDLKTELPRDTLLSVEIVHELKGEVGSYSLLQSDYKYNVQFHLFSSRYCRINVPCVTAESLLHLLFREMILD